MIFDDSPTRLTGKWPKSVFQSNIIRQSRHPRTSKTSPFPAMGLCSPRGGPTATQPTRPQPWKRAGNLGVCSKCWGRQTVECNGTTGSSNGRSPTLNEDPNVTAYKPRCGGWERAGDEVRRQPGTKEFRAESTLMGSNASKTCQDQRSVQPISSLASHWVAIYARVGLMTANMGKGPSNRTRRKLPDHRTSAHVPLPTWIKQEIRAVGGGVIRSRQPGHN